MRRRKTSESKAEGLVREILEPADVIDFEVGTSIVELAAYLAGDARGEDALAKVQERLRRAQAAQRAGGRG